MSEFELTRRGWTELDGRWWKETYAVDFATAVRYEDVWATDRLTNFTRY